MCIYLAPKSQGRQDGSHPHQIVLNPAETHAYVCDLGLNRIVVRLFVL